MISVTIISSEVVIHDFKALFKRVFWPLTYQRLFHFIAQQNGCSTRALENHRTRCSRLEEQAWRCGLSEKQICARAQQYEARWMVWADGQLCAAQGDD